ncbi:MAG: epoxyqueuosine reductase QueH [Clostridia bacterium]|nr:epoxyqueuosine reductase QueH [Clostridia bacterium]
MKKLLLHSCCGPCSSACIERLLAETEYEITVFYYNPNIYPESEYLHRKSEQIRLIGELNNQKVKFLDCDYEPQEFERCALGLENEKEGGARCPKCFALRLSKTAQKAKELGYDAFATTLTVSPHKNAQQITEIGNQISTEVGVAYLPYDFKKKEGFKRSIELSKEYNLYRQNYCGCRFSLNN